MNPSNPFNLSTEQMETLKEFFVLINLVNNRISQAINADHKTAGSIKKNNNLLVVCTDFLNEDERSSFHELCTKISGISNSVKCTSDYDDAFKKILNLILTRCHYTTFLYKTIFDISIFCSKTCNFQASPLLSQTKTEHLFMHMQPVGIILRL